MKKSTYNPKPFQVRNILGVKASLQARTYLHFTARQWKQATEKIPSGKAVPKYGLRLAYFPFPDGGVIVQGDCVPGKCETDCMIRIRRGPEGEFTFSCRCKRDPACLENGGGGGKPGGGTPKCELRLLPGRGFRCLSQGCTGSCKMSSVTIPGGRGLIVCVCN
jgi:hypothetical protein